MLELFIYKSLIVHLNHDITDTEKYKCLAKITLSIFQSVSELRQAPPGSPVVSTLILEIHHCFYRIDLPLSCNINFPLAVHKAK